MVVNIYKFHKGNTQSIAQHSKAMASYNYKQQQIKIVNNKPNNGYKPKWHKHIKNKTTKLNILNEKIIKLNLYNMLLRIKLNKLNEP